MTRKEKQLFIGVLKRFNSFFGPWDLELYDHKGNYYYNEQDFYKAIRKMNWKELKKEIKFWIECINIWRKESRKQRGNLDFLDFMY